MKVACPSEISLGLALLVPPDPDPVAVDEQFESSLALCRSAGDVHGESMALTSGYDRVLVL